MITFKRVTIKNFRAYEDMTIEFAANVGVFLMSGDNGSGKSSFLNAINWCLYGDTPFFTVEDIKEVVNLHAAEGAEASVELFAEIRGIRHRFYRSTSRGAPGGILKVSVEKNGDWSDLNGVYAQDAVRKVLPKDLRHLFFFNGEQLKDIFSKSSKDHDLQSSVYKVSELDVLDNAIKHLAQVEKLYLDQISKQNKNADTIEKLNGDKEDLESRIEGHAQVISELMNKVGDKKKQIAELDKKIKDTANARYILEKRDDILQKIQDYKDKLDELYLNKADIFRENFHRLILNDEFAQYNEALVDANRNGVLPPPINPAETERILKDGVCICGRPISEHEREYIEKQHKEYSRLQELQYLTDGMTTYAQVVHDLPDVRYQYSDLLEDIRKTREDKMRLEEELKKVNESLEGIDQANLHDNPELRRTHLLEQIDKLNLQIGFDSKNKDQLIEELKKVNTKLDRTIGQDNSTQRLETLRLRAQTIGGKLVLVKDVMEKAIRDKLQKSVWETFSAILPDTNFLEIKLDKNYALSLIASDGITYSTGMLATGPTKVLGLSLAYALSRDLGYADVPFLIDNLYGDIKDTHFDEITKMISSLAADKQIIIMDLNIDRTERGFGANIIVQKFMIKRLAKSNKTIIEEIPANES